MSDEQSTEQILSCLEDVRLILSDVKQHTAMVVVEQAAELIAELWKDNEQLKADNFMLKNFDDIEVCILRSIRDRLLAWGETVALYVLEDMPKLGGIIATAKASKGTL